jgi:hypothetical protein
VTILIILIAVAVIAAASGYLVEAIRRRGRLSAATAVGGILGLLLIAYGLLGFFGAFLSATGRLAPNSERTEIPMGRVDGAVIDADGLIYCPSTPWGRVQLYDRDKRFIRGWFVGALGGTFRLHIDPENHLEVATARGRMVYVFDREGRLLSSTSYAPRSYSDFDGWRGSAIAIPTPLYLLPLTHPVFAWGTALAGMLIVISTARRDRTPRPGAVERLLQRNCK